MSFGDSIAWENPARLISERDYITESGTRALKTQVGPPLRQQDESRLNGSVVDPERDITRDEEPKQTRTNLLAGGGHVCARGLTLSMECDTEAGLECVRSVKIEIIYAAY